VCVCVCVCVYVCVSVCMFVFVCAYSACGYRVSGLGGVNKQQLRLEWEWIYSWLRSDRRNAVTAATPSRSNVGKFWMEGRCYYKEGMLTVAIKVAVILPVLDALEVMLIITAIP